MKLSRKIICFSFNHLSPQLKSNSMLSSDGSPFILEDHLIFSENIQIFLKEKRISKKAIDNLFKAISQSKIARPYKKIKVLHQEDGHTLYWSIIIFKITKPVSFLDENHPDWQEERYCYLLLIEFEKYCAVVKKNISGISSFQKEYLIPIDYQVLSKLFLSKRTEYQALSLLNIDTSEYSTRKKSFQSNDLKKSMSPFGIHRYIINHMRVADLSDTISLTLNTSRINKIGSKVHLVNIFRTIIRVATKIENFKDSPNYVDSFASPISYKERWKELTPTGILFLFGTIQEHIENGRITHISYETNSNESKKLPAKVFLRYLRLNNKLLEVIPSDIPHRFQIDNPFDDQAILALNKGSIRVRSKVLNGITLNFENKGAEGFIDWMNRKQFFLVSFTEADTVFFSGKLFQDSRLLGSIDLLKGVFRTFNEIKDITSEKGVFEPTSEVFSENSLFHFIYNKLPDNQTEYLFCDDLGDEWADFIEIKKDKICLFHAKYKKGEGLSAANFQDVIGQALKNLGNAIPTEDRLQTKEKAWSGYFRFAKIQTKIPKLLKGKSVTDGVKTYREKLNSPNTHIEIYIVINFISKKRLFDNFEALSKGVKVERKAQVIQLLWFVSSFVNSCKEIGFKPYIICQP
jgi:hypothetical protein